MVEPEIYPPALCLLDDIVSILLTESSRQSSRDVCETAHEASVLKFVYVYICLTITLLTCHFRLGPGKCRESFSSY